MWPSPSPPWPCCRARSSACWHGSSFNRTGSSTSPDGAAWRKLPQIPPRRILQQPWLELTRPTAPRGPAMVRRGNESGVEVRGFSPWHRPRTSPSSSSKRTTHWSSRRAACPSSRRGRTSPKPARRHVRPAEVLEFAEPPDLPRVIGAYRTLAASDSPEIRAAALARLAPLLARNGDVPGSLRHLRTTR